jgi:hypothetical protein
LGATTISNGGDGALHGAEEDGGIIGAISSTNQCIDCHVSK